MVAQVAQSGPARSSGASAPASVVSDTIAALKRKFQQGEGDAGDDDLELETSPSKKLRRSPSPQKAAPKGQAKAKAKAKPMFCGSSFQSQCV